MGDYKNEIVVGLLCLSVMAMIVPIVIFLVRTIIKKQSFGSYRKSIVSRMLIFSAWLMVSVFCLRYAVGYFNSTLTWWEEIFNSIVHTLQTFSMDEDYTKYILEGKAMIGEVFEENTILIMIYGIYASILNFIAPIAGGAIIFEILASVFPQIKLRFSHLGFWHEKYYFSELNESSLTAAKSICSVNAKFFKNPTIIFTSAYINDEDEAGSKLLLEAKLMGAICVKDDLAHVKKNRLGKRKFFLIDNIELKNLQMLSELANSDNSIYLKKSEIYLFTNDDAYIQVEASVRDKLHYGLGFKKDDLPVFVPIKGDRNLISSLLVDVPLYEPLIGRKTSADKERMLTVAILGTGNIGTEMFLSTYWLGQILNCRLKINLLSQESEAEFWSKIDYINPEIKHTTIEGHRILQINRKGDMADVYCEVNYIQCDVKSSEFISYLTKEENNILDSDYFFVALGSDEYNISVANTLKKYVGERHIKLAGKVKTNNQEQLPNVLPRAVITYVVFDPELSQTLNRKQYCSFVNNQISVYMKAVGSLTDIYSVKNIFLTEYEPFAQQAYEAYNSVQNQEERAKRHKARIENDYEHWASLARAMHTKYKIFSMGMIKESLFDYANNPKGYLEKQKELYEQYKVIAAGQIEFDSPEQEAKHLELLHQMAWLEHRRWNAFTRIKGFRGTTDYSVYAQNGKTKSYKQMDIKLHPCLVECDKKGIKGTVSSKGIVDQSTLLKCTDDSNFDLLDDLSYELYKSGYNDYDFKMYDYLMFSFK